MCSICFLRLQEPIEKRKKVNIKFEMRWDSFHYETWLCFVRGLEELSSESESESESEVEDEDIKARRSEEFLRVSWGLQAIWNLVKNDLIAVKFLKISRCFFCSGERHAIEWPCENNILNRWAIGFDEFGDWLWYD